MTPGARSCAIVANCQGPVMADMLRSSRNFSREFTVLNVPPVHLIREDQVEALHTALPYCDMVIAQAISEDYRDGLGLGTETIRKLVSPSCHFLTFPSLYFAAYNPELFFFKDQDGNAIIGAGKASGNSIDYHNKVVFSCFMHGYSCDAAEKEFHELSHVSPHLDTDAILENLVQRGAECDIEATKFILRRFRSERLFWSMNHPSTSVLHVIISKILHAEGIDNDLIVQNLPEYFRGSAFPIMRTVYNSLKLGFRNQDHVEMNHEVFTVREYVELCYAFYRKHKALLVYNTESVLPAL